MFRGSLIRAARAVARSSRVPTVASRSTAISGLRLNSTQPFDSPFQQPAQPPKTPEELAKKAALEAWDDLQRDWDVNLVIPYEEFLVKTQNPSPVRAYIPL